MTLFVSLFFFTYGSMHAIVLRALHRATAFRAHTRLLIVSWCLLMVTAPVLVRFFDLRGWIVPRTVMATTGYLWMAWIFLAMMMLLASDVLQLALSGADAIFHTRCAARVSSPRTRFRVVAAASLLLAGYGVFEAQSLRVTPVVVAGSPAMRTPRFRIAHVSDVHLGPVSPWRLLERIEAALDAAAPDLVVFTGDLVDGRMDGRAEDRAILSRIASRFPTLAVTGNHEMIAGLGQAVEFLRSAGIAVLRNRAVAPEPWLYVAGVDDPASGAYAEAMEQKLLDGADGAFTVLLKHRPSLSPLSEGRFDLQLAGHTHGGQIFPFSLLVNRVNGLTAGVHRLAGRGVVAVSRGAGTWGPPVRLLAPPEILIFDIVRP